jgi:hypothetical protein
VVFVRGLFSGEGLAKTLMFQGSVRWLVVATIIVCLGATALGVCAFLYRTVMLVVGCIPYFLRVILIRFLFMVVVLRCNFDGSQTCCECWVQPYVSYLADWKENQ